VSNTCTFDFDTISSEFETICGQLACLLLSWHCFPTHGPSLRPTRVFCFAFPFYAEDISCDCNLYVNGLYYDVTYQYLNYPASFGGSCTDAKAMDSYETLVFPGFEKQLALGRSSCDVMGEVSQASGENKVGTSASVRGALSFVVMMLSVATAATSSM
jgi:hypothetical protein